jgi:TorA maturation chaperone TorD
MRKDDFGGMDVETNVEAIMKGRIGIYSFLAKILLDPPDREILADLKEMILPSHPYIRDGFEELKRFISEFKSIEELEQSVKDEFNRLFIDPYGEIISPYQSSYEGDTPYNKTTLRVKEFYRKCGYSMRDASEPADHISVELLFMAESCKNAIEGDYKKELECQRRFLDTELSRWISRFCDSIDNRDDSEFYRAAAKILKGFIKMERDVIQELELFTI